MQPVGVDVQCGVWLHHSLEMEVGSTGTEVAKRAVVRERRRRMGMNGPRDETEGFSTHAQRVDAGTVEAHLVVAPEDDTELS